MRRWVRGRGHSWSPVHGWRCILEKKNEYWGTSLIVNYKSFQWRSFLIARKVTKDIDIKLDMPSWFNFNLTHALQNTTAFCTKLRYAILVAPARHYLGTCCVQKRLVFTCIPQWNVFSSRSSHRLPRTSWSAVTCDVLCCPLLASFQRSPNKAASLQCAVPPLSNYRTGRRQVRLAGKVVKMKHPTPGPSWPHRSGGQPLGVQINFGLHRRDTIL